MAKLKCPRCSRALDGRFYGPCQKCRKGLREAASTSAVNLAAFRGLLVFFGVEPE